MKVGVIDADLIGRKNHRFPNLACMKLSAYFKSLGYDVSLKTDYDNLERYGLVTISKVFTDTVVPEHVLNRDNIVIGGTGFFYDKAPKLPYGVEHVMPDYSLYSEWVKDKKNVQFYTDYSIGFTTRGCFRQCSFCVNKNYRHVEVHSPLYEFVDWGRKKIGLLDDNVLGSPKWREIIEDLQATGKPFRFIQGMDERLLTEDKCKLLFSSKYDGDYTFAFDDVKEYDLIEKKLKLMSPYIKGKNIRFYVLVGFDRSNKYDLEFWKQDMFDTWKRIQLLMKYGCKPYIMRFNKYVESPYAGTYITLARWANQPSFYKKKSLSEFIELDSGGKENSSTRYRDLILKDLPDLYSRYYDMKFEREILI